MSFVWLSKYIAVISLNSGPYKGDAIFCGKNLIFKNTNFRLRMIKGLRKILQAKQFPYSTSLSFVYLKKPESTPMQFILREHTSISDVISLC
jgi:hypothetical protein